MKPYMLFLLAFASFLYAKDGLENKEVLHLEEAISLNTLKSAPDEPDIGEGGAANTLQQMESVAKGEQTEESVDDSNENEDNEIIDSEPEDNLEDQETVTLSDSISFPDTLFIDMTRAYLPTENRRVTSPYGMRTYRIHKGIDVKVQKGDTIRAAFPGIVSKVRYERRGYGKYVMIEHVHCGITKTVYAHLSRQLVTEGDTVQAGDVIGLGGNTGRSTGSHLHFETRINDMPLDPATFFDFANQTFTKPMYALSMQQAKSDYEALQKVASAHRYYKVRPGDSLGKIARKNGTSIEKICRLNGIKRNTVLRVGRMLRCT
jgi:murein DD-endopeptidase MepM/ murein hydrolase activator NlpD